MSNPSRFLLAVLLFPFALLTRNCSRVALRSGKSATE